MKNNLFTAVNYVYQEHGYRNMIIWMMVMLGALILALFLPWTQNIKARGSVTTLRQEQRPQQLNTIIAGRIESWQVKEGDFVKKGDTLLRLSETKPEYLDPELLARTAEQVEAKQNSISFYRGKAAATDRQIGALSRGLEIKLQQLENKVRQTQAKIVSDSMDVLAAVNDWQIAQLQLQRQNVLYDSGLVSLTQLEQRKQTFQTAVAKKAAAENKLLASRQELAIVNADFNSLAQEYSEKMLKAEAEKLGSLSSVAQNEAEVSKLRNQYENYRIRNNMYYVIAPQDGQIISAKKAGIGEVVKEGELLLEIVPGEIDYAVEMYVRPVDLPLVSPGQKVRFIFDGFPAIVFSGWPNASYGTFQGTISAVESNRSENGMFRILVQQDNSYRQWPPELKVGTGASGIALLKTVPVWYELWRMINSFPKDYYKPDVRTDAG